MRQRQRGQSTEAFSRAALLLRRRGTANHPTSNSRLIHVQRHQHRHSPDGRADAAPARTKPGRRNPHGSAAEVRLTGVARTQRRDTTHRRQCPGGRSSALRHDAASAQMDR